MKCSYCLLFSCCCLCRHVQPRRQRHGWCPSSTSADYCSASDSSACCTSPQWAYPAEPVEFAAAGAASAHTQTGTEQERNSKSAQEDILPSVIFGFGFLLRVHTVKVSVWWPRIVTRTNFFILILGERCENSGKLKKNGIAFSNAYFLFVGTSDCGHSSGYGAADPETTGGNSVGHHRIWQPVAANHRHVHQRCHLCKPAIIEIFFCIQIPKIT